MNDLDISRITSEEQYVFLMHEGPKQHSAWVKQRLTAVSE